MEKNLEVCNFELWSVLHHWVFHDITIMKVFIFIILIQMGKFIHTVVEV